MAEWFAAPALVKLNQEIQARWPGRDTASDGVLGDASHQAGISDHNPCWTCSGSSYGIVRATDRDVDGWPATAVRDWLIARCRSGAERRLAYLINNRTIWSATYGWAARSYTGDNPHLSHIHFSLKKDSSNFNTSPWLAAYGQQDQPAPPDQEEEDDMPKPYIVPLGGAQFVVAADLSSRTGIRTGTDLAKLAATGQYITGFVLTESQMAAIPFAGQQLITNLEDLIPPPIDG